jgi:hypothetical protein
MPPREFRDGFEQRAGDPDVEIAASRLRRVMGHGIRVEGPGEILARRDAVLGTTARELMTRLRAVCAEARRDMTRIHPPARSPGVSVPETNPG